MTTSSGPGSRAGSCVTRIVPGLSTTSARRLLIARNYDGVARTPDSFIQSRRVEVDTKLALVRTWLDRRGLSAVTLTHHGPVAWLSGGLTNPIDRGDPVSPLWFVVTPRHAFALTTIVEQPWL